MRGGGTRGAPVRGPMPDTVRFDPFATVIAAFEALYPDTSCGVMFAALVDDSGNPEKGCGCTVWPDEGGLPQLAISFRSCQCLAHGQGDRSRHLPKVLDFGATARAISPLEGASDQSC